MQTLTEWDFSQLISNAKQNSDPAALIKVFELMEKQRALEATERQLQMPFSTPHTYPTYPPEPEKISWEQDEYRNTKAVTLNVRIMVENLLGGRDHNRDVQVRLEQYGCYPGEVVLDHLHFVVVNICDIKTGSIITLRETYAKFPSPEFLTKLELLRVGKSDGV